MTTYNFSANGLDFGNYVAVDIATARKLFARDAGYAGWDDMVGRAAEFGGNNVEVCELLENGRFEPAL